MNFKNIAGGKPAKEDWFSSLVVFIVAIPLSLGIAVASGAPPAAGMIAGIIGGIVVGLLAGAPLTVTGPAAGLSAIVLQLIQQYGLAGLAVITVLAGLFQFGFGVLKGGRVINLIPKPVLEGTLAAIGVIILIGQVHVMLGLAPPKSVLKAVLGVDDTVRGLASHAGVLLPVAGCGLLGLAIQIGWPKIAKRLAWIPAALPAVILVTLISLNWDMQRVELTPLLPTMKEGFRSLLSEFTSAGIAGYILPAFMLAIVAAAETLLTARGIDVVAANRPGFKPADLNRELVAQGAGNTISGLIGGLPMTSVMVRSMANVTSGAKTRWSTVLHGAWIAVFLVLFPAILMKVPLTALASVLIITAVRLLNLRGFQATLARSRMDAGLWLGTTVAILSTDLLKGLGIALAGVMLLRARDLLEFILRKTHAREMT